ncbi:MAG: UDP-N-acetylglucosamine 2-epimerase (hydrolyzing), partial [Alcaligenaceae bacterium]|nr:UDP-N-acetylglucosamine 2-epimerase (hydrolyzing) [Alcaligenaceae bacterium]
MSISHGDRLVNNKKKILFLTGTRADFGKLKSLIRITESIDSLSSRVFVTGMHMLKKYGSTFKEVEESGFQNIHKYINQHINEPMEMVLASTIHGLSRYVHETSPDMIVVHGDRVEALAGAIVGSMNNILVAHIEGGERSGTIDELIRHSVTKLAHIHLVSNEEARKRVVQMGEAEETVFIIGSADIDFMKDSTKLPSLDMVKKHYDIPYEKYHIVMFHPVTTEVDEMAKYANNLVDALLESDNNYVVIYPNNDHG